MLIIADENIPLLDEFFADFGEVKRVHGRHLKPEKLEGADVLLVRSITQVNQDLLSSSAVSFVASATIGTDHIDKNYLLSQNIEFANAPGCNAESVADYVLSALLNLAELKGETLQQKKIGVVGVGNVGSAVKNRLEGFGCKVLCNDPPRMINESLNDRFVDLDTLIESCDVICLHTPLIKGGEYPSYHLFDDRRLRSLNKGAWLLNAGRGGVIDNQALKQLLLESQEPCQNNTLPQHGRLEVILDVWESEPQIDTELLPLIRWGTPHIAGYSLEGRMRGTEMVYQALCRHFDLPIAKKLSDFLPNSETYLLKTDVDLSVQSNLLEAVNACYDLRQDDMRLRIISDKEPALMANNFDRLRREYPKRRQFSSTPVVMESSNVSSDSDIVSLLRAIGFPVK